LTPRQLQAWNQRLTVVSISDFGQAGPWASWKATDLVLCAMSGVMQISGTTDREPLKRGLRQAAYTGGLTAAYTALLGYLDAAVTGAGALADVSLHECLLSEAVHNQPLYAFLGFVAGRRPATKDPLDGNAIPCADGEVTIQATSLIPPARLAQAFDDPRLERPEFSSREGRHVNAETLTTVLGEHVGARQGREFFEWGSRQGLLCGFVQDARELLSCPHLGARGVFTELPSGPTGWRMPGRLAEFSSIPQLPPRPAPALGEHTLELLAELAGPGAERTHHAPRRSAPEAGSSSRGPLSGLRVLDFSTVFAMPYVAALLTDMGAEVIKVEAPHRLDQTRVDWGGCFDNEPGDDSWNRSTTFQVLARGKRSLALDARTPEGRAVLSRLIERTDVLIESFSPRVMTSWGMSYYELTAIKPDIVMLSNSGYGATGPWSSFKAQGTTLEATMGLQTYSGYREGPPSKVGQSYPDFLACWSGLLALMAALIHRDRAGEGQHIDLGMYQLGVSVMPEALLHEQAFGENLARANGDLDSVFSAVVPAEGDDRWLAVSVDDRSARERLSMIVGAAETDGGDHDQLAQALQAWAQRRDGFEAAQTLQEAAIAAGPVMDARDLMRSEHLRARSIYEPCEVGHGVGRRRILGRPYMWEARESTLCIRAPSPDFAEANDYVLRELLGLDAGEIAALRACGAVADAPVNPPVTPRIDVEAMLSAGALAAVDPDFSEIVEGDPGDGAQ
jgi:formyl-CoA transferase